MSMDNEELDVIKTLIKKRIIKKVEQEGNVITFKVPTTSCGGLYKETMKYDGFSIINERRNRISLRQFLSKLTIKKTKIKKIKDIIEKYNLSFKKRNII